jgi:cellobiose-specific phosphotransferase system component IIA
MKSHWTVFTSIVTLCALCLSTAVVYTHFIDEKGLESQGLMADENPSKDTTAELRVRLFEAKEKLKEAHKERFELKLKLEKALTSVKAHELKLAEIISGEESGVKINESLLKELVTLRERSGMTSQQFEELYKVVINSYKLLKADNAVEEKFKAKAALIREEIASLLTAGNLLKRDKGLVLSINEKLDVVAISLGYSDGVTQSSEWQVKEAGKIIASLKIVEVRKSISLGVLTKGSLQEVPQGAIVVKIVKSK